MVGITERGDPKFNDTWINKLNTVDYSVIISKDIPDKQAMFTYKDRIIFHATTTGYGGSSIEPGVLPFVERIDKLDAFCKEGFPKSHVVIRIDPIIPTQRGCTTAKSVVMYASSKGFNRFRFSFLDIYPHVRERFANAGMLDKLNECNNERGLNMIRELAAKYPTLVFESCAEVNEFQSGCINTRDLHILELPIAIAGRACQRKTCMCPAQKKELLDSPHPCAHGCLYCYWK